MDDSKRFRPILVPSIICLNILVFVAWKFFGSESESPMTENFLVSWDALAEGRIWTLLTSVFSHNMLLHIFVNMFVLNSFGTLLEMILGRRSFLSFYLLAGILSSLSHCLVSLLFLDAPGLPALGASGAVAGLVLVFSFIFPKERILLLGFIPIPALFGALVFIGLDIWGLVAQAQGGGLPIGHGAHLGGAFTGIIYYYWVIRPRLRRRFDLIV